MKGPGLTRRERTDLLRLARAAIVEAVSADRPLDAARAAMSPTASLEAPCGVFVTLRKREGQAFRLRGCIGRTSCSQPLWRSVVDLAPRTATEDSRFPPLRAEELPLVRIGISVLSPFERIDDPAGIRPGLHGVQLARDGRRSVFLPEVAVEQGWDVGRLLRELAAKAGLPADAWRGAELSVFASERFSEPEA